MNWRTLLRSLSMSILRSRSLLLPRWEESSPPPLLFPSDPPRRFRDDFFRPLCRAAHSSAGTSSPRPWRAAIRVIVCISFIRRA